MLLGTGQEMLGGFDRGDGFVLELGGQFGHAQVMQFGIAHVLVLALRLFDDLGHEEQALALCRGVLHIGFALVGLAGHVFTQAQHHVLDGGYRVGQGLDTGGIHSLHFFDDAKKTVELREHALTFF